MWNRIKSAVLEMPVVQIAYSEGAPMGAAMLAGAGVGLFKSLPAVARRWVQKGTRYRATKAMTQMYSSRLGQYEKLLGLLGGYFDQKQG